MTFILHFSLFDAIWSDVYVWYVSLVMNCQQDIWFFSLISLLLLILFQKIWQNARNSNNHNKNINTTEIKNINNQHHVSYWWIRCNLRFLHYYSNIFVYFVITVVVFLFFLLANSVNIVNSTPTGTVESVHEMFMTN